MDKPEVVTAPGTVLPPPRLQLAPPPKSMARKVRILQSTQLSGQTAGRTIHEPELVKPEPTPVPPPATEETPAPHPPVAAPPPPGSALPVPVAAPEELPVLAAFKAFLEGERRRTRNRMLAWGAGLAAVLLIILAAALSFGLAQVRRVDSDFAALQTELAAVRTDATGEKVQGELQSLATETRSLEKELGDKDAAIATVRKELSSRAKQLSTQINGMKTSVDALKKENTTLKKEVALARQAAALAIAPPTVPALPVYPAVPVSPALPLARPQPAGVTLEFQLSRPPPAAALSWRVAITE